MTKSTISKRDGMIFKALQKAVSNDKLRIYLDYGKVNRPNSPIYNAWESLLPILIPLLIGVFMILSIGVLFGLLFIIGMIIVYTTYFKKKLYMRVIERTKAHLTTNITLCQDLWNFGGIVLVSTEDNKNGCVSPDGDWKEFVVKNFSDYMIEKTEKVNEQA